VNDDVLEDDFVLQVKGGRQRKLEVVLNFLAKENDVLVAAKCQLDTGVTCNVIGIKNYREIRRDATLTLRRVSPARHSNPDSVGRSNILARCNYIPITTQANDGRRIQPCKNTGLEHSDMQYSTTPKRPTRDKKPPNRFIDYNLY
jgi:hypothetical protein